MSNAITMEPLSARIPSDIYLWFAQLQLQGATTNSDKLRVLLGQLKRQDEGSYDYVAAHAWAREFTGRMTDALVRIEGVAGKRSEVLFALLDHATGLLALLLSQTPRTEQEAARLEDSLVKKAFALFEMFLRQATTDFASAHDPQVIHRHLGTVLELVKTVHHQPETFGA